MRQMEPHVKWHFFFGRKVIFSISDVPESISMFPANFKKISDSQIFDLSHRAKISHFQNMHELSQYGLCLFSIDARSDPSKYCGNWPSKIRLNVNFQNQKLAENGEFDK